MGIRASTQINNDDQYLELDGSKPMAAALDMGSNKIINLATPVNGTDAANKSYVDTEVGTRVSTSGDTMSGDLDMGSNQITNLGNPTSGDCAISNNFADGRYVQLNPGSAQTIANSLTIQGSITLDTSTLPANVNGTAAFNMDNGRITNVHDPYNDTDAANKRYVDAARQGVDYKESVRVATTGEPTFDPATAAPSSVDGVALAQGDRVLLMQHTTGSNNGIYVVDTVGTGANGSWSRAPDADSDEKVSAGMTVYVEEGTQNADSLYTLVTDDPITVGTTALNFTLIASVSGLGAGNGLSKSGQTLNVNVDGASISINADTLEVNLDPIDTIEVAEGLRVADATAGQILIGQGVGTATSFQTIGGDATLAADGTLTLTTTYLTSSDFVKHDNLTSQVGDGTPLVFTTTYNFVNNTEEVYLNGQQLCKGTEYTVTAANEVTIDASLQPSGTDKVWMHYEKA